MWTQVRSGMLLAVLGGVIPFGLTATSLTAQVFPGGCHNCQRPVATCNCTAQRPVVETQMVPQQVTSYRNEVVTQYRQEAYTQAVPVTTYRDVVVDEGGYQTVYVPKMVTKRVPQTVYQQQTAYRSVPYQVTRQVPQVSTQMVPQQIVRYQPYSYQTTQAAPIVSAPVYSQAPTCAAPMACAAPMSYAPVASPCLPCGGVAYSAPTCVGTPVIGQAYHSAPVIASVPAVNPVTILPPQTAAASDSPKTEAATSKPVPDPKFLDAPGAKRESWSTVGSRNGTPSSNYEESRAANASGLRFKPARTVFRSWEEQSRVAAGEAPARQ